ncbi:MAG TPA: GTP-binding protein [Acetobacteraceae bacterium]|nr:GTP-binding protein [Acetobacteraceae bacterium]
MTTDFLVLTGFLGSGKTTLLRDFLALPEAVDTAVIVNEVGAIGLDGAILAEGGDVPVLLLGNGCVCCSLGGDLERSVARLIAARARANLPPARRIVLETSGVSKPAPILRSLASLPALDLRVGVVATFDCARGLAVGDFEEAAAQWAGAQAIVLTKRDLVDAVCLERARKEARGVGPLAALIDEPQRAAAARAAFTLHAAAPRFVADLPEGAHPRITPLLARFVAPVPYEALATFLDDLAGFCGERLLRVKGVVRVQGAPAPLLIQSVGTMFSAPRPFASWNSNESFLVLILRDAAEAEVTPLAGGLPVSFGAAG